MSMIEKDVFDKFKAMLIDHLSYAEGWNSMKYDIEIYQKIRELVIGSFECTLEIMPPQVKANVIDKMIKLRNAGYIFEFDDLEGFLTLAQIFSTTLLSNLDNKKIQDFAAPHRVIGVLDRVVRLNEDRLYNKDNLSSMGAEFNLGLFELKKTIEITDWKKGW